MHLLHFILTIFYLLLCLYSIFIRYYYKQLSFLKPLFIISVLGTILHGYFYIMNVNHPFFVTILFFCYIMLLVIFFMIEGMMLVFNFNHKIKKADGIIVLGAGLDKDKIPLSLQYRLDACITYFKTYSIPIVVSGGQGKNEWISEAKAMKDYLILHHIPNDKIIIEDKSTSTYENLKFSQIYFSKSDKLVIITNGFHLMRSLYIARKLHINAIGYAAKNNIITYPLYAFREFFAFLKNL